MPRALPSYTLASVLSRIQAGRLDGDAVLARKLDVAFDSTKRSSIASVPRSSAGIVRILEERSIGHSLLEPNRP